MTKQQIQALIDAKIAGQGSAVDVGGALPTILHEILEAAFAGENVQSNWDEADSNSPQYIQNKPTIPAAQVQSDWSQSDSGAVDYIKNKPTGAITVDGSTGDGNEFIPDSGQPEKDDVVAAFISGKSVILYIDNAAYAIVYAYYDYMLHAMYPGIDQMEYLHW